MGCQLVSFEHCGPCAVYSHRPIVIGSVWECMCMAHTYNIYVWSTTFKSVEKMSCYLLLLQHLKRDKIIVFHCMCCLMLCLMHSSIVVHQNLEVESKNIK